jgi:hypothetical protein
LHGGVHLVFVKTAAFPQNCAISNIPR